MMTESFLNVNLFPEKSPSIYPIHILLGLALRCNRKHYYQTMYQNFDHSQGSNSWAVWSSKHTARSAITAVFADLTAICLKFGESKVFSIWKELKGAVLAKVRDFLSMNFGYTMFCQVPLKHSTSVYIFKLPLLAKLTAHTVGIQSFFFL